MPRIVVSADPTDEAPDRAVLLDERIVATDLASDHFAARLIERIGWALLDADRTEQQPAQSLRRRDYEPRLRRLPL